jgi:putative hydrolase of the HAD superfamily
MIDAVLFDLGDTIINFGVGRREAELLFRQGARLTYDYLLARGVALPEFKRYFKVHYRYMSRAYLWSKMTRRDFSYADIIARAGRKLGFAISEGELAHLCCLWYKPIGDTSHIDLGVHHMLEQLRAAGTKLAIVSNTFVPPHCLDEHLEQEGLLEFFPVRVYSSCVRYRKPHPRIFELALDQIGVSADRALFIGDLLLTDIAGAKRAGMRTIWKPGVHTTRLLGSWRFSLWRPRRRHAPDFTIRRVTQLPEALHRLGWRPSCSAVTVTV